MKVAMLYKVKVIPYDVHWASLFKGEANRIREVLGACLKEIYHTGSTSIPDNTGSFC